MQGLPEKPIRRHTEEDTEELVSLIREHKKLPTEADLTCSCCKKCKNDHPPH